MQTGPEMAFLSLPVEMQESFTGREDRGQPRNRFESASASPEDSHSQLSLTPRPNEI